MVPYMPPATDERRQGFVRIVNHDNEPGVVEIDAFDDSGSEYETVSMSIGAGETRHFNSDDLEVGNLNKGLPSGVGAGNGAWRLGLHSNLDVEVLAYVRTTDGFLTSMHALAPESSAGIRIATFNPGSNAEQVSILRVINPSTEQQTVTISGIDDIGHPSVGQVNVTIPAHGARMLTSRELENGTGDDATGLLGDGEGKWRLTVASEGHVHAMSLLSSPTGHRTNLSTVPVIPRDTATCDGTTRWAPMFPSTANAYRQGFLRVINRSEEDAVVRIWARDDAGRRLGPLALEVGGKHAMHLNSNDLEFGNPGKGLSGLIGSASDGGDWWLELHAPERVETLAYIRTEDGFVTSMHDVADRAAERYHRIAIFNPGRNASQASLLRLVNPGREAAAVDISGLDDRGEASTDRVRVFVPPGGARTLTSAQLEEGDAGQEGALGLGKGKWQLTVRSSLPIQAMSLLSNPTGHWTNLSATTGRPVFDDTPRPDVIAQDFVLDDQQFLSFTLANRGSAEVPEGKGSVAVFVDGWLLREYPFAELVDQTFRQPGASQTVATDLRLAGKNRRVAVVVDRANAITEVSEYQNALTRTVSLPDVSGADIGIRDVSLDSDATVEFVLENLGTAPFAGADSVQLTVYVGSAAISQGNITLPDLAVGEVVTLRPPSTVIVEDLERVRIVLDTDAGNDWDNTNNSLEAALPRTMALEALGTLLEDPKIARAIAWADDDGIRDYGSWTDAEREDLNAAFLAIGGREGNRTGPPPFALDDSDAWSIYTEHVAQSLWVEVLNVVPWSLLDLDDEQLGHVLGYGLSGTGFGFRFFSPGWTYGGDGVVEELGRYAFFNPRGRTIGVTDWSPQVTWEFLENLGLVRSTQLATVAALTDWMRSHLRHWAAGDSHEKAYGYKFALVDKMLFPTGELDGPHVSRGCWDTTNLYWAVLRTINIPTYQVSQPLGGWDHSRPEFPTICRSMAHADDVHSSIVIPSGSTVSSVGYLYTFEEMESLFVQPQAECDGFCNTLGEQVIVNNTRQQFFMGHRDMTDYMLGSFPDYLARQLRGGGIAGETSFAKPIFNETEIEAILKDVERRQKQIGGGDVSVGRDAAAARHRRFEKAK